MEQGGMDKKIEKRKWTQKKTIYLIGSVLSKYNWIAF